MLGGTIVLEATFQESWFGISLCSSVASKVATRNSREQPEAKSQKEELSARFDDLFIFSRLVLSSPLSIPRFNLASRGTATSLWARQWLTRRVPSIGPTMARASGAVTVTVVDDMNTFKADDSLHLVKWCPRRRFRYVHDAVPPKDQELIIQLSQLSAWRNDGVMELAGSGWIFFGMAMVDLDD